MNLDHQIGFWPAGPPRHAKGDFLNKFPLSPAPPPPPGQNSHILENVRMPASDPPHPPPPRCTIRANCTTPRETGANWRMPKNRKAAPSYDLGVGFRGRALLAGGGGR